MGKYATYNGISGYVIGRVINVTSSKHNMMQNEIQMGKPTLSVTILHYTHIICKYDSACLRICALLIMVLIAA